MSKKNLADLSFGGWLRQRRRLLDLTQQELAQQVGCARITLRRIEAGGLRPSKELANILLKKLGVPEVERTRWILFARGLAGIPDQSVPPSPQLEEEKTNIPITITSFVGREKEQAEVIRLIEKNRLVTLAGTGGIGKTRLAQEVGRNLLNDYHDGIWFIALDSLSDPALVPHAIASVFDIREGYSTQSLLERLTYSLRQKSALLIFDNCEHLLHDCGQLIKTLLTKCPNLKVLATSREVLSLGGEAAYYLRPFSTPEDNTTLERLNDSESIRLFTERASLALSSFQLTKENAQAVLEICRRVDGIPLAIELAAGHMNILQAREISKQLDNSFSLLSIKGGNLLERHQTLRASIDWSWGLLSDPEERFMRQLSVFVGGWSLEAAQAVSSEDVFHLTSALVKKSLIVVDQKSRHETRYRCHEMVRRYAHEKLSKSGEEADTRTRHLKYFLQLSEQAELALRGSAQREWHTRLRDDRDNIRAALEWAVKTDVEAGLYITSRLRRYWESFDIREGAFWLAEFIQKPESMAYPLAKAEAFLVHGHILGWMQKHAQARSAVQECLKLFRTCGDRQGEIDGLLLLGYVGTVTDKPKQLRQRALALAQALGDVRRQALALFQLGWSYSGDQRFLHWEQALTLMYQTGDWGSLATLLSYLGNFYLLNGNLELAQKRLQEAERLNDQLQDKGIEVDLLGARGRMAMIQGDYTQARTHWQKMFDIAEEVGLRMAALWCCSLLAYLCLHEGNLTEAGDIFVETTGEFSKDKNEIGVVFNLEGMAALYVASGKPEIATALIGWADATREKIHDTRPHLEQADVDKTISACIESIGEVPFSDTYDKGQKMSLDEAVTYALGKN